LTDFGRVRIEFETRIKYEVLKDFYLGLGLFDKFDSRPPVGNDTVNGAIKNDFGIETTINWRFK
jgi:hypothetical protein